MLLIVRNGCLSAARAPKPRKVFGALVLDRDRLTRILRRSFDLLPAPHEDPPHFMAGALTNSLRLARAGTVLAQHGVRFVPKGVPVPLGLRAARLLTAPIRMVAAPFHAGEPPETRVAAA